MSNSAPSNFAPNFKVRIMNELIEDFGSIGLSMIKDIADESIDLYFNGRLETGSQVIAHARNCAAVWAD